MNFSRQNVIYYWINTCKWLLTKQKKTLQLLSSATVVACESWVAGMKNSSNGREKKKEKKKKKMKENERESKRERKRERERKKRTREKEREKEELVLLTH